MASLVTASVLFFGSMVGYAYSIEFFIAWYGGNINEIFAFVNRALGPYAWAYWIMVSCNVLAPQLFWFKRLRRGIGPMMLVFVLVNIGMWFERYVIVVTSLSRDYLPSSWGYYSPTWVELAIMIASAAGIVLLYVLFTKFFPIVSIWEIEEDEEIEERRRLEIAAAVMTEGTWVPAGQFSAQVMQSVHSLSCSAISGVSSRSPSSSALISMILPRATEDSTCSSW